MFWSLLLGSGFHGVTLRGSNGGGPQKQPTSPDLPSRRQARLSEIHDEIVLWTE
jgi:hypothetical protein